jgi:HAD superfamily hydrolase (TIGR01509 family)
MSDFTDQVRRPFRVSAVLFDFDDTLTLPGALDFEHLRTELGCPPQKAILEYIADLPSEAERRRATARLSELEMEAAGRAQPNPAAGRVISWLRAHGLGVGIITRNGRAAVARALQSFPGLAPTDFAVIVSRDEEARPKPDPEGVLLAARSMGVPADQLMVVGDFVFDILAGRDAGAITVLLQHRDALGAGYAAPVPRDHSATATRFAAGRLQEDGGLDPQPDAVIADLADLPNVVRLGLPLPAGKFPNDLLDRFLDTLPPPPEGVIVGPRVGRDVAALDLRAACSSEATRVLAVGSDPVTFTADALGRWAVLVNANDVVTCGAVPRWFFATLLFPLGTTPSEVLAALRSVADACDDHGIALCGGHTEITEAVAHPIVSGTMLGTTTDRGIVHLGTMCTGDAVLLTKRIAAEGTALLAFELADVLRNKGMSEDELAACRRLRKRLSVVDEALAAVRAGGVTGMHDVTEGGLATAVLELAEAGAHVIDVEMDAVPLYPQTERLCQILGIDPFGLIGSGSLLITCNPAREQALITTLAGVGTEATRIGTVGERLAWEAGAAPGRAVRARRGDCVVPWPTFDVDEVARALRTHAARA